MRGLALARYADLLPGPMAARVRADAARALLDGGDRAGARAVLAALVADSAAPAEAQGRARAALIEALLQDGQLDSAAARLATLDAAAVDGEERQRLRLELVRGWGADEYWIARFAGDDNGWIGALTIAHGARTRAVIPWSFEPAGLQPR